MTPPTQSCESISGSDVGVVSLCTGRDVDENRVVNLMISGSWQELLFELVGDMDPWDINLKTLSMRFMKYLKSMSRDDLKVSAKVLLVAVIIYRMKVDSLHGGGDACGLDRTSDASLSGDVSGSSDVSVDAIKGIDIPPISILLKRVPRGKLSLDDLVDALEKAMKVTVRRMDCDDFAVELCGEDISEHIENLFAEICRCVDGSGSVGFSCFVGKNGKSDKIRKFFSLLHLYGQERVSFRQDKLFGEIYLTLSD